MSLKSVEFTSEMKSRLAQACAASAARSHLVTAKRDAFGRTIVTAHTVKSVASRKDNKALLAELKASGLNATVKVRSHADRKIASATSLQSLLARYEGSDFLHDPTGAFGRSAELVDFAQNIRASLSEKVAGIYWNTQLRTAFVVLNHTKFFADKKVKISDLAETESAVRTAYRAVMPDNSSLFVHALRIGFEIPAMSLVPVDAASVVATDSFLSGLSKFAKVPAFAAMVGLGGAMVAGQAAAADPASENPMMGSYPAVSGLNFKIGIAGGLQDGGVFFDDEATDRDSSQTFVGTASVTTPILHSFGFQLDGLLGYINRDDDVSGINGGGSSDEVDGEFVYGVGGHLFWRDPMKGLVGLTASYVELQGDDDSFDNALQQEFAPGLSITRVGAEGELYLEQFTVAAGAGYQFINFTGDFEPYPESDFEEDGLYAQLDLSWYATDNLVLSIGAATDPNADILGTAGVEWAPAIESFNGLSLFADGIVGEDDYVSASLGVRFYFGEGTTLKTRHRFDDPVDNLPGAALATGAGNLGY